MATKITLRQDICQYVESKYNRPIEYLWARSPMSGVFRHEDNRKWFGIIMNVKNKNLGLGGEDEVDVLNVKIDDAMLKDYLLHTSGFLPAYHMNKNHWISILLDGSVELDKIYDVIDMSFGITASKK